MKGTIVDFLNLAAKQPDLARELVELAGRHGFEFSDEVSESDLDAVAGGSYVPTFNSNQQMVADNIAGQTESVKGAADSLSMASDALRGIQNLLGELQGSSPPSTDGEATKDTSATTKPS